MKHFKTCSWLLAIVWMATIVMAQDRAVKPGVGQSLEPATYQIRNKQYQELLRPKDANSAEGTQMVLYSPQPWKCMTWKVQPATNEGYSLRNVFTSKTFAAGKAGESSTAVVQVTFSRQPENVPVWQFTKMSDGTYEISEVKTSKALTAVPDVDGYGERIVLQPWQDSDAQKWELLKIDPKELTM